MILGLRPLAIEPLAAYVPPPVEPAIDYQELSPNNVAELVTLVAFWPFKKATSE